MLIRYFTSELSACQSLAAVMLEHLSIPPPANRPTALMVSGGKTPLEAYRLAADAAVGHPPGLGQYFLLSDERLVEANSPHSNLRAITPFLLAVGAEPERLLLVDTSLPAGQAAEKFHADLSNFLVEGGSVPLGILGIGSDGHTAGIFTESDIAAGRERFALSTNRPDGLPGVSVSPSFLQRVRRLVLFAMGKSKTEILRQFVRTPLATTVGKVLEGHPHVELWTDCELQHTEG